MDIGELFKSQFNQMRKEDQAKYFLMKVEKVQIASNNSDSFRAIGTRVDNGAAVAVTSQKSSSGQHLPEVGGILRADKVSRLPPNPKLSQLTLYKAEYFHAYGQDELCLRAIVQAEKPRTNSQTQMQSAQVHAFDIESNVQQLNAAKIITELDRVVFTALKPWAAKHKSKITHDVKDSPVWGDGKTAKPGLTPFAVIRFEGQSFKVYGTGMIKEGPENAPKYRLPKDSEILSRIQANANINNLKSIAASLPEAALSKLDIYVIPGLSITVGRDSLNDYIRIPEAFDWINQDKLDGDGKPTIQAGFRLADIHVKESRKGRMMAVNAVPAAGGNLTKSIPLTKLEREARAQAQQSAPASAAQSQSAQQATQPSTKTKEAAQAVRQQAPNERATKISRSPAPTSAAPAPEPQFDEEMAPNAFDEPGAGFDDEPTGFEDDFESFAQDLAAMEMMDSTSPQGVSDDQDVESLLNEAAARQSMRRSRPSM